MRAFLTGTVVFLLAGSIAAAQVAGGDARAGRRLAGGRCSVCHGNDGIATQQDVPNLAGQNASYVMAQLRAFRGGSRRNEQMTLVARGLTNPQIADLASWYSSIEVTAAVPPR